MITAMTTMMMMMLKRVVGFLVTTKAPLQVDLSARNKYTPRPKGENYHHYDKSKPEIGKIHLFLDGGVVQKLIHYAMKMGHQPF